MAIHLPKHVILEIFTHFPALHRHLLAVELFDPCQLLVLLVLLFVFLPIFFVEIVSFWLLLLLCLSKDLLLCLGEDSLQLMLLLYLEFFEGFLVLLLCLLAVLSGGFDDGQQFGFSIFDGLLYELLLHPHALILGTLLSFSAEEDLFLGFHLFGIILLQLLVSTGSFLRSSFSF